MATTRILIESFDSNQGGFPVMLIEETGQRTTGITPLSSLVADGWRIAVAENAATHGHVPDVTTAVADSTATPRTQLEWTAIAQLLCTCLLPPGPVRDRFHALAPATQLYLKVAEELSAVPWEFAQTTAPAIRPAVTNGLSRLHDQHKVWTASSDWPFRILVLVGCTAADEAALGIDLEVATIRKQFLALGRSVDVKVLRRPDKNDFRKYVSQHAPHVLHFAGHAQKVPGTAEIGLKIEAAPPWPWTSIDIQNDLTAWGWTPRFVFLNACRSAVQHAGSWGLQRGLLQVGVEAVLAMQADVRGDIAGRFAAELYSQCADGRTIQDGLREARIVVAATPGGPRSEWALPSLVATSQALQLFSPRTIPDDEAFESCREFDEARYFANCHDERRAFTHWLVPATNQPAPKPQNALVLKGVARCGKSHLVKWCMETWALAGARVRYVEVHDGSPKSFLSLVRQIRDGEADDDVRTKYLHDGLPAAVFRRFNWELNNLLETGQRGEWKAEEHQGEREIADAGKPPAARGEKRLEPDVCAAFHDALKEVAAAYPRGLVLVFDKLGGPKGERLLDPKVFDQLIRHLFRPIIVDPTSMIRLVFSVSATEYEDYFLSTLPAPNVCDLELKHNYQDDELVGHAKEMAWFNDEQDVETATRGFLVWLRKEPDPPKGLAQLSVVTSIIKRSLDKKVKRMR
jgi:hypothetical protein